MGPGPADTPPASNAAATCADADNCSPAEVANRDWDLFRIAVRNRLPNGVAYVNSDTTSAVITVGWLDPARVASADNPTGSAAANEIDAACAAVGLNNDSYRCYSARVSP
jgi:hypothetical protein